MVLIRQGVFQELMVEMVDLVVVLGKIILQHQVVLVVLVQLIKVILVDLLHSLIHHLSMVGVEVEPLKQEQM